jgi:beta-phosphoglucomutase-like phosphatase (HAD superfamily)
MKGNKQVASSSSSSSSEDEDENDDDDDEESDDQASTSSSDVDEETIQLIEGVEKMLRKLNTKGVPITIEDIIFTNRRREQR